jgi:hypothetical protein
MLKRIILAFSIVFFASAIFAQREVIEKVIANVGSEYVLLS